MGFAQLYVEQLRPALPSPLSLPLYFIIVILIRLHSTEEGKHGLQLVNKQYHPLARQLSLTYQGVLIALIIFRLPASPFLLWFWLFPESQVPGLPHSSAHRALDYFHSFRFWGQAFSFPLSPPGSPLSNLSHALQSKAAERENPAFHALSLVFLKGANL